MSSAREMNCNFLFKILVLLFDNLRREQLFNSEKRNQILQSEKDELMHQAEQAERARRQAEADLVNILFTVYYKFVYIRLNFAKPLTTFPTKLIV